MLVCQSGLGANKALHWTRSPTLGQEKQIEQLLAQSYKSVLARLRSNRELLDDVARLLIEKQEIGGPELCALTATRVAASSQNGKKSRSNGRERSRPLRGIEVQRSSDRVQHASERAPHVSELPLTEQL
jgi:hypothetical protein